MHPGKLSPMRGTNIWMFMRQRTWMRIAEFLHQILPLSPLSLNTSPLSARIVLSSTLACPQATARMSGKASLIPSLWTQVLTLIKRLHYFPLRSGPSVPLSSLPSAGVLSSPYMSATPLTDAVCQPIDIHSNHWNRLSKSHAITNSSLVHWLLANKDTPIFSKHVDQRTATCALLHQIYV